MTEVVSWFCLVIICAFGLIRLLTGLYYYDHPPKNTRRSVEWNMKKTPIYGGKNKSK